MKINYPNKKKSAATIKINSNSKSGMSLEEDLNESNIYYLEHNIAVIHKKPTPIQVVHVDYPLRSMAKITEAYYKTPSTTDYNGIYNGYYIDFEAKETTSKTSFPLKNIHPHQVEHLKKIIEHGGIGFLIVLFKNLNQYYLLPFDVLNKYWNNMDTDRKSIPIEEFNNNCYLIKEAAFPRLDYLKIVKEHLIEKDKKIF